MFLSHIRSILLLAFAAILPLHASEIAAVHADIDQSAAGAPISPYIYGVAQADMKLALELGVSIRRLGGNTVTPWNWKTGFTSAGADWFFVNKGVAAPPEKNWWVGFHKENLENQLEGYLTLPMMGRVAKDGKSVAFDIKKYPGQETWCGKEHPGWEYGNAGNGRQPGANKKARWLDADPNDTSIEMPLAEQVKLLEYMIDEMKFGRSKDKGVKFVVLDNEPGIWHSTHRGMHPQGCSYDEIWSRTRDYAAALKKLDPGVKIAGPAAWGWTEYFYSGLDTQLIEKGQGNWGEPPDFAKHGKVPLTKWYLRQLADYEKQNHVRLLDTLDFHFYPQANVDGPAHDPSAMEKRVQETRVMWDPNFKDSSWMGSNTNGVLRIVPMMREWIGECYPGTKTAIGEYDFKGQQDASGGVTQAELLGIFAREQLDFAFYWFAPEKDTPIYFGFRMFRNPDGKHSTFGETYLPTTCSAPDDISIHAARDSAGKKLTLILINKRGSKSAKLTLNFKTALPEQETVSYEYSDADAKQIKTLPPVKVSGNTIEMELAPISVRRMDVRY
jgi:hypothetical protein